jgi:hypothetical protein
MRSDQWPKWACRRAPERVLLERWRAQCGMTRSTIQHSVLWRICRANGLRWCILARPPLSRARRPWSGLDVGGVVGVRARHVDAGKVDFDVRHRSPLWNHHVTPAGEKMTGMEHVTPEPHEDPLPPNAAALAGRAAARALVFEPPAG